MRPHRDILPLRLLPAAALAAALGLSGCGETAPGGAPQPSAPTAEASSARPTGVPILLVGIDAADWEFLRPLADRGELPRLGRLASQGATAVLRSEEPLLSPILWTTIATGRDPLAHGVLDFLEVDPAGGGAMPVSARQRRTPALWDLFSAAGLDVAVIAWWGTWPAYPLRGRVVSDRVAYSLYPTDAPAELPGLFFPSHLQATLGSLALDPAGIDRAALGDLARVDDERLRVADAALASGQSPFANPLNHLRAVLASTLTYHRMALALLEGHQPSLFAVYYQGVDEVNHRFAHCTAPALRSCPPREIDAFGGTVEAFYRLQDRMLGELLDRVRDDTVVVVVSDHGFLSGRSRPRTGTAEIGAERAAAWHRLAGVWMMAGPPIRRGAQPPVGLRDIAPTVLYLAGLPLSSELGGRPALGAIDPGFVAQHPPISLAAYTPWAGPAASTSASDAQADRRAIEKLEALGYLSAGAVADAPVGAAATRVTVRRLVTEAALRQRNGEVDEAVRLLRRAVDVDPEYAGARSALAVAYLRGGRAAEALPHFRRLLPDAWETSPGLYPEAARAFLAAGRVPEAVDLFNGLEKAHPEVTAIRVGTALLLSGVGDVSGAGAALRDALRRDPLSLEAMAALVALLDRTGHPEEAVPFLQAAVEANPDSAPHHRWLGRLAESRGRFQEAVLHYMRGSDAAPGEYGPVDDLGRATALAGRPQEAVGIFESAARAFPEEPRAPFNLGAVLQQIGDAAGAHRAFLEAEHRGLHTAEVYRRAGDAAAAAGLPEDARRLLARSLELEPEQPEVSRALEALAGASR